MKLRVENLPNGHARARGKVWPTGDPEPAEWMIEKVDPIGVSKGAPGLYGGSQSEMYYDILKVIPNSRASE
jgi:hypothetical protein